jgi:hypothetical protein
VVAGGQVFWANEGTGSNGTIMSVPPGGGTLFTVASALNYPEDLAANSTTLFTGAFYGTAIESVPFGGTSVTTIATAPGGSMPYPELFAADASSVYWVDFNNSATNDTILQTSVSAGGAIITLASGRDSPGKPFVQGGTLYWAEPTAIYSVATGGVGKISTLVSELTNANREIVGNTTTLYFLDNGSVMSLPIGGATTPSLVASSMDAVALAIDSTNVYFLDGNGFVATAPLGGGTVTKLTTGLSGMSAIGLDANNVYFTLPPTGSVMQLSKN